MADLIQDFGAVGDGVTDDTLALRNALASGQPIEVPEAVYKLTGPISLPPGAELIGRGRPTFRGVGNISGAIFATAGDGVLLRDINIDADKSSKVGSNSWALQLGHGGALVDNVAVREAKTRGIYLTGFKNTVHGGYVTTCTGPATQIWGGWGNILEDTDLSGNTGFGCHLDNGAHDNRLEGLQCYGNGLELIGATYSTYGNRINGCHAEATGDNGFSLTGYENLISNCRAIRCKHSGIRMYGSRNSIVNNLCRDNGQRWLLDGTTWAGIIATNGWGGLASDNVIEGNICLDTQAIKTQSWGLRIGKNVYAVWGTGQVISAGNYKNFGLNIYKAMTSGTSGQTAPTHTSGTVSDGGIDWLYVTSAIGNLDPVGNVARGNVCRGNRIFDYQVETTNRQDVSYFDAATNRPLWATAAGPVNALGQAA